MDTIILISYLYIFIAIRIFDMPGTDDNMKTLLLAKCLQGFVKDGTPLPTRLLPRHLLSDDEARLRRVQAVALLIDIQRADDATLWKEFDEVCACVRV